MKKQAMDSGNADIIETLYLVAVNLRRQSGFFRDRNVARAARGHYNGAKSVRLRQCADPTDLRLRLICKRQLFANNVRGLPGHPRNQDRTLSVFQKILRNAGDLLRRLSGTIDHLCCPLADPSVQIHLGVAEIVKRFFF